MGRSVKVLVIDVGGTHVKVLATGKREPRRVASGPTMTASRMVAAVKKLTRDWSYDAISIGYPGPVLHGSPVAEPKNLAGGWVGFDFRKAFGKRVRVVNDAAMQALGSYEGGRMLFLGLGTGLGAALIAACVIVPLELGQLPFGADRTLGEVLGRRGLDRLGKKAWRQAVARIVPALMGALLADDVVVGGGNASVLKQLPPGTRCGHNLTAFLGGARLWHLDDVRTLSSRAVLPGPAAVPEWRVV